MIITHIILQLLASVETEFPQYRADAITILDHPSVRTTKRRGHSSEIHNPTSPLQSHQICYGLAQLYLWGKSDVLRQTPTFDPSKKDINRAVYWYIEAAKLGAPQTQEYLVSVIDGYNLEMLYTPSFFSQLKEKLQKELQSVKKTINVAMQEEERHITPPSNDSTYVGPSTNPMDSKTTSEEFTPETPE